MSAARPAVPVARAQYPVFAYLLAAVLVETLFFVVLSPLLPVYAHELRLGRSGAGVMSACYAIGYGLASVPAGTLVGRLGQRAVSLAGLALVGAGCAAFGLARDVVLLDAARLCTGVGAAAVWSGSIPWLLSLGAAADRGRLIGLAFSAASAGACAGPVVGALATLTGPRRAFLGLSVLIAGLVVGGAVASAGREPPPPPRVAREMCGALRIPGAGRALVMVALPSIAFGVVGVLLPLRLHDRGLAEAGIAAAYLVAAVLAIVANAAIGPWFDRAGGARVMRATLVASLACAAVLALPVGPAVLVGGLVISLPVIGAGWVPSLAQLSALVEGAGSQAGVALGLFNIDWALSQTVGAIGGPQLSRAGEGVPFLVLAGLFALGAQGARRLS